VPFKWGYEQIVASCPDIFAFHQRDGFRFAFSIVFLYFCFYYRRHSKKPYEHFRVKT